MGQNKKSEDCTFLDTLPYGGGGGGTENKWNHPIPKQNLSEKLSLKLYIYIIQLRLLHCNVKFSNKC